MSRFRPCRAYGLLLGSLPRASASSLCLACLALGFHISALQAGYLPMMVCSAERAAAMRNLLCAWLHARLRHRYVSQILKLQKRSFTQRRRARRVGMKSEKTGSNLVNAVACGSVGISSREFADDPLSGISSVASAPLREILYCLCQIATLFGGEWRTPLRPEPLAARPPRRVLECE